MSWAPSNDPPKISSGSGDLVPSNVTISQRASILMPYFVDIDAIKTQIESECSDIKVSRIEHVISLLESSVRFRLEGSWGCNLKFMEPAHGNQQGGRIYEIDLGDGC